MSKKLVRKLLLLGLVLLFIFPAHSISAKGVGNGNGKGKSDLIPNITAKDIGDNGDGRDLQVHFNVARDKSKFDEYRIFVVRSSKAGEFDLDAANSNKHHTTVSDGKNIKKTLAKDAKDTGGNLITNDVAYTVFVLSVKDKGKTKGNVLSKAKKEITLSGSEQSLPAVIDVKVADISNNGNGRDLHISFSKLAEEKNLSEYRVFVVKSDKAQSFELKQAKENKHYTTIAKTGANIAQSLAWNATDTDGHTIKNDVSYQVFVMSVAKEGYGDALSLPSSAITLQNSVADLKVTNILVKDVADFGDGRDLQVEFTVPRVETNVVEYRVMVVPTNEAYNFSLQKANLVTRTNYTAVKKAGANLVTTLASNANDVNGNKVEMYKSYQVFVMTVGNGTNELSNPSAAITLWYNMSTEAVTNVAAADVSNFGDGRDLQVSFTKVNDETPIAEYRIFVVRASDANSFDLAKANAVSVGNYTTVTKKGSNISQTLASNARDVSGNLIENSVVYKVFVMSVSGVGHSNALSNPSGTFYLTK